jgi:hypothetical protein
MIRCVLLRGIAAVVVMAATVGVRSRHRSRGGTGADGGLGIGEGVDVGTDAANQ